MTDTTRADEFAGTRLEWVAGSCRLLQATGDEFAQTRPFEGLTLATAIHLEPKTAALLLTLKRGGATVVSTGNLNSTQPETMAYLRAHGMEVIGEKTKDAARHAGFLDQLVARRPAVMRDNGGDLFSRFAEKPYDGLLGGTEETTSGRMRLTPLRERIRKPVLVINDSPIKQFAENRHAVGQSVFESVVRFTNRMINGRRVTVFGYGACGKGVAACFRNGSAVVTVVYPNPVTTLEAHLDGFLTPPREEAMRGADILITITGAKGVITAADLGLLKDGAILANAGHFPWEIDVAGLQASPDVEQTSTDQDEITTWRLKGGRRVHLLGRGHMVNLAGPRPLGNSIESMDLGFTLQARCLEAVARGQVGAEMCLVPVPAAIDARVANAYLAMTRGEPPGH
jgi:adenosylhomocysteinase